ncbi:hypothetical protein DRN32_03675 [Thermococci archaeon]|nr:MAG: hypothetical protein DRN32_03675 [Thermococci archaeon]
MGRKSLIVAFVLITLFSNVAYCGDYSQAQANDYGAYMYFNSLLMDFNSLLEKILENENGALQDAELFSLRTNSTLEEVLKYRPLGLNPSAVDMAYKFKSLGESAFILASSKKNFLENTEKGNFVDAQKELFLIKYSRSKIYTTIEHISRVRFIGEKEEILSFDVEEIYGNLKKLDALIAQYENILNQVSVPKDFLIFSSKNATIIGENVTFYGYTLGLKNLSVIINNSTYSPEIINGVFKFVYSFNRTGVYSVYAQAINGTQILTSNKIEVIVERIPTFIIAIEKTEESPVIEGYLVDCFGNYLSNREILVKLNGTSQRLFTDENGTFTLKLGRITNPMNATLVFLGDETYSPANSTISLLPKRRLVIRLFFERDKVRAGEKIQIHGSINGSESEIPLEIYLDNQLKERITAEKNFTITLTLEEGRHVIYARFPGNDRFRESISNLIEIQVVPYNYFRRAVILMVFIILGFLGYRFLNRPRREAQIREVKSESKEEIYMEEEEPDVVKSYRFLYNLFRKIYGLPKSITPRELLKRLEGQEFGKELKKVTLLHEKVFYGKKKLKMRDILDGVRTVARVVVTLFVREEL